LLSVQWINSWWWTDELSETCRVSWQNKFVKLVHLVGFITKKFAAERSVRYSSCFCNWNFQTFFCPSSGIYSLYTQLWYTSYRFVDSFRAGAWDIIIERGVIIILANIGTVTGWHTHNSLFCHFLLTFSTTPDYICRTFIFMYRNKFLCNKTN